MLIVILMTMITYTTADTFAPRTFLNGDNQCSRTPANFESGNLKKQNSYFFTYRTYAQVCRDLGCGNVVSITFRSEEHENGPLSSNTFVDPEDLKTSVHVTCTDSVRLVNGAGLCSGRVEVKIHQSWTTVCETHFDWQDAKVVCRELGCGTPLTLQAALFGEGKGQFEARKFKCKGTEKSLLTCGTSHRKGQSCSAANAVGLICSGPDDVKLVNGGGGCSGTVMIYSEQWRKVNADRWSMREAAVVCRQLDCGSAVSSTISVSGRDEADWGFHVACKGSEPIVRECTLLYSGLVQFPVEVICSDSVRLVDGAGFCSGRVEVKTHQSWTTVCGINFDWQDAEVVCRELGCGTTLTLQGALYGEVKHPFGTKEFQCKGTEDRLITCKTRQGQNCRAGCPVALVCSEPADVRLVGDTSRCAGILEMFYNGQWRRVDAEIWLMQIATLMCRQLDCGSALAAMKTKSDEDVAEVGVLLICNKNRCLPNRIRQIEYFAQLVCSDVLVKPTISVSTPRRVYTGQSFTITCSIQPQYSGGFFHLKLPWTNTSQTQTAVNHLASFFFPSADDSHQGIYRCIYENQVTFQTEVLIEDNKRHFDSGSPGPFIYNFSSESETLSLTVSDFPLIPYISRMLLVPFLFTLICLLICIVFKKCGHYLIRDASDQKRAAAAVQNENMEMVVL